MSRYGKKRRSTERQIGMSFISEKNFYMFFWLFIIGSVVGFILEGIWVIFCEGRWEHHSGLIWGPFCIIYGIGTAGMYAVLKLIKVDSIVIQFFACALCGSVVEYIASFLQELFFNSYSWNYSVHQYNLSGRVSLDMAAIWGFLGIVFSRLILPPMRGLIMKIHGRAGFAATWFLVVFMILNFAFSAAAVNRWRARISDEKPQGKFEEFIDIVYDDEKMNRLYPNLHFK